MALTSGPLNRLTLFNNEIVTFLYSNAPDFAIYDTLEGGDLIISATDERLESMNNSVDDIITMKSQLSSRDGRSFHPKIAGAMRLCLMNRGYQASTIFKDITKRIQQSRKNMFRLLYLSGATSVMVLLGIFTFLLRADVLYDFPGM